MTGSPDVRRAGGRAGMMARLPPPATCREGRFMPRSISAPLGAALFACLSGITHAQTGLVDLLRPDAATRGGAPTGEVIARFDADHYRGLCGFSTPSTGLLTGMFAVVQDADGGSASAYVFHVYDEGAPNLPTIPASAPPGTTARVSVPVTLPISPGPMGWTITVSFGNPLPVTLANDLFLGVEFTGPGQEELAAQVVLGMLRQSPGPGLPAGTTWALAHNTTTNTITPIRALGNGVQLAMEPRFAGPSGLGITQFSALEAPTASFFTGLYPDTAQPPRNPGRADVPGYQFLANGAVPAGSLVMLLASLSPFVPPIQVPVLPGQAPVWLDQRAIVTMSSAVLGASGQQRFFWSLPPNPPIAGLAVFTQAVALDVNTFVFAAGAAVRHQF